MFKPKNPLSASSVIVDIGGLTRLVTNVISAVSRLYGEDTLRSAYEVMDALMEMQLQLTNIRLAYSIAVDELELRKDTRVVAEAISSAGEEGDIPF